PSLFNVACLGRRRRALPSKRETPSLFNGVCLRHQSPYLLISSSSLQVLLENHQVIGAIRVPADADDVVAEGNREVEHGPVLVVALEADVLVVAHLGPGVSGFHQLRGDSLAAVVGGNTIEPGVKDGWLQLETEEKADGLVADAGDH